jgi:hypothetical protein
MAAATAGGASPALAGMQIFGSFGANTTVSGDNLRMALTASGVPVDGPLAPALAAIQTVAKDNDHITITNNQEVGVMLGGRRTRVKEELSFDVAATAGLPVLNNIQGCRPTRYFGSVFKRLS